MIILVCGGAGFIGSAFIRNYFSNHPEHKIINLDSLTIGSNLQNLREIEHNHNYQFIKDDIKNQTIVNKLAKDVDIIVNFAAESHVGFVARNDILGAVGRNHGKDFVTTVIVIEIVVYEVDGSNEMAVDLRSGSNSVPVALHVHDVLLL